MNVLLYTIAAVTLVSAFVLPAVAPYHAVYVTMAGLTILTLLTLIREAGRANMPVTWVLLSALGLIVLATLLAGPQTAENWLAPAVLVLPLLSLGFLYLPRIVPGLASIEVIASLAFIGAALGVVAGAAELGSGQSLRMGVGNNPIHYAGIMLLLGFIALAGFEGSRSRWRYIFLLGPALGLAGVFLSGSRGPFLAAFLLIACILPLFIAWHWRDKVFLLGMALSAAIGFIGFAVSPLASRAITGVGDLYQGVLTGNLHAVDIPRSQMLEGAFQAFRDSPIWGHGWANMMPVVEAYFPDNSPYEGFDHLHNDVSNFAVLGGTLGLVAYALVIVGPLLAWWNNRSSDGKARLIVALVLAGGFFGLGLTNTMIGILPQTVLYGAIMGALIVVPGKG
ncbi:O-antigen ligase family protein [Pelagibacterium sediminicola]|uniref:O-antigen ligase family protein n=1 Tax=Pelagibacterium sediminicola TaxID=2248761 RepID=UPI000E3223D7|nr:O-antigen ligase family protein [Pelagibacterium sediminicola]